jgi:hypothetical protein
VLSLVLLVLAAPKGAAAPAKPLLPPKAAVFVSSGDEASAAKVETGDQFVSIANGLALIAQEDDLEPWLARL